MTEICFSGLSRPDQASLVAAHGATHAGVLVNQPSDRGELLRAREIVTAAGSIPVLATFAGRTRVGEILDFAGQAGLAGVRLAPPHSTADARRLRAMGLLTWRELMLRSEQELAWMGNVRESANAVVISLDSSCRSGALLPLALAREARAHLPGYQMVLSGRFTPVSAREAISEVRPDILEVPFPPGPPGAAGDRIQEFMEVMFAEFPPQ